MRDYPELLDVRIEWILCKDKYEWDCNEGSYDDVAQ